MKLKLTRPLIFLDIESTGVDKETDRIIDLCFVKISPDLSRQVQTFRYNPGMPIPPSSTEIHGITDEDVKDCPLFKVEAEAHIEFIAGCDLAGYNSNNFDIPLLYNELIRAGFKLNYKDIKMIDAGNIFKIKEARTLAAAVKFYTGKDHQDAHSAEADTLSTVDVFLAQLEKYEDLPTSIDELALFSNYGNPILDLSGKFTSKDGNILFNFGKYRGEKATDHLDFVQWMVRANFPSDTIEICYELLNPEQNIFP